MNTINIFLILIIIFTTIILSLKKVEKFINQDDGDKCDLNTTNVMYVKTRPCAYYLTSEENLCDKLEDYYELSNIQLQIMLNAIKNNPSRKDIYNTLLFVKNNKDTLPYNSCKIQLNNWIELKNVYTSNYTNPDYKFKNITIPNNYSNDDLNGYCFKEIVDNNKGENIQTNSINKFSFNDIDNDRSSNIVNNKNININIKNNLSPIGYNSMVQEYSLINDNSILTTPCKNKSISSFVDVDNVDKKYIAMGFKEPIDIEEIKNDKYICDNINIKQDIENGKSFIKLYCILDNLLLKCNKIAFVKYNQQNNIFEDIVDDKTLKNIINKYFGYYYDDNNIIYGALSIKSYFYIMTFNICNKLKKYYKTDNKKDFSFDILNIQKNIIGSRELLKNIDSSNLNDMDYKYAINNNINANINLLSYQNTEYNNTINDYNTQQDNINKINMESLKNCNDINNQLNYNNCYITLNSMKSELYTKNKELENYNLSLLTSNIMITDKIQLNISILNDDISILSEKINNKILECNDKINIINNCNNITNINKTNNSNDDEYLLNEYVDKNKEKIDYLFMLKNNMRYRRDINSINELIKNNVIISNTSLLTGIHEYISNDNVIYIEIPSIVA